jgi:Ca2+/Na+ antiporter
MIIAVRIMFLLNLSGEISQGDGILLVLGYLFFNVLMLSYVAQERRKIEPAITKYYEEENLIDESLLDDSALASNTTDATTNAAQHFSIVSSATTSHVKSPQI